MAPAPGVVDPMGGRRALGRSFDAFFAASSSVGFAVTIRISGVCAGFETGTETEAGVLLEVEAVIETETS